MECARVGSERWEETAKTWKTRVSGIPGNPSVIFFKCNSFLISKKKMFGSATAGGVILHCCVRYGNQDRMDPFINDRQSAFHDAHTHRGTFIRCTNLHDLWSQDADAPTRADTTSDGDITAHAVHGIPSKRRLSVWPVWMKDIVGVREEYLGSWVDQPVCDGGGGDERKDGKGTH